MILLRTMLASEVERIAEIDRSETITRNYQMRAGRLESVPVEWQVPRWSLQDSGGHSVNVRVTRFREMLGEGAVMLGAFDVRQHVPDRLAGFAVLCYRVRPDMAELSALFVSRDYRRQGIAARLFEEVERLARLDGAARLYVSATPSDSAVGFYQRQGFAPAVEPLPERFEMEPEDIHMIKELLPR